MSSTTTRSHALRVLLNMISKEQVRMKLQEAGGLPILVEQLKPPHNEVRHNEVRLRCTVVWNKQE